MTAQAPLWRPAACVLALAVTASSVGCKSGGESRWAWNPFKRAGEEISAIASADTGLPSDTATPRLEVLEGEAKQAATTAIAQAQPVAPPAGSAAIDSTIAAVSQALPQINKPAATPYPTTGAPAPPTAAAAPVSAVAASGAGPYDPNGYKPAPPAATQSPAQSNNRYASTGPLPSLPALPELPPVAPKAERPSNRYAQAGLPPLSNNGVTAPAAATPPLPTTIAAPTAVAAAPSTAPAAPSYPATSPVYPATTPAAPTYPVASTTPATPPAANDSGTLGTLPALPPLKPAQSVYAATPTTPIQPAAATQPSDKPAGSVVRLTTLPGEYRPGGTSTYQPRTGGEATGRY